MKYRLGWLAHWSTKREPSDPRVTVMYHQESDGWWEHEYLFYFIADNDEDAKVLATEFINGYANSEELDVYSLVNIATNETILTEEQ